MAITKIDSSMAIIIVSHEAEVTTGEEATIGVEVEDINRNEEGVTDMEDIDCFTAALLVTGIYFLWD